MQSYVLFPVLVACAVAGFALIVEPNTISEPGARISDETRQEGFSVFGGPLASQEGKHGRSVELLLDIEAYEDPDYGFSVAIPTGWRKIVTAEPERDPQSARAVIDDTQEGAAASMSLELLEPGYAVGFESVQQNRDDRFADYILIEILPGNASGLFYSDGLQRQPVTIDGRSAWYDRLEVDEASSGLTDVDLVIYQAEFSGLGYTVGLYAIGEPEREAIMSTAFGVMLSTFKVTRAPFSVS
ncbi:MAG: hypothetical protein HKN42_07630 [Granulosicoccus sp.]|nr:hypothetical protein [Granulosicoccus sp.]